MAPVASVGWPSVSGNHVVPASFVSQTPPLPSDEPMAVIGWIDGYRGNASAAATGGIP